MNPYEILGIQEGAEKAQIKKAYFRLLREHTPEKDPEGFARIREAYERLSNPERELDQPSFHMPDHPYAKMFAKQIEDCLEDGRPELARDTAEEGWERFPGTLYFLYQMTVAQRICGNSGKAFKNAQLLTEKEPENRWFWRERALSAYERGYTKKAYPAFVKAYELGCRDLDFLMMFCMDCRDYPDFEKGKEVSLLLADPSRHWDRDYMEEAIEAYYVHSWFILALGENISDFALQYAQFMENNQLSLVPYFEECMNLLGVLVDHNIEPEPLRRCMRAMQGLNERESVPETRQNNQKYLEGLRIARMNNDENICRSLQYLNEILVIREDRAERFEMTDCKLCMLEEREQILKSEAYMQAEYPDFYEKAKPYLDRMRTQQDADKVRFRLQQDYRKMLEYYDPGNYLDWYPEQRDAVFGKQVVPAEETYVRIGRKIGRNDPCPCGSGKKYKFCCGRK